MACFAIRVKTGCERVVANHIQSASRNYKMTGITSVLVPMVETLDFKNVRNEVIKKKTVVKLPSYVFVVTESTTASDYEVLHPDTYHLLLNMSPHIKDVLRQSIDNEEMKSLTSDDQPLVELLINLVQPTNDGTLPQNKLSVITNAKDMIQIIKTKRNLYEKYIKGINNKGSILVGDENAATISLIVTVPLKLLKKYFFKTGQSIFELLENPHDFILQVMSMNTIVRGL